MTKVTFVIDHTHRLNNSKNGNPRFLIVTADGDEYITQSDGSVGFEISNLSHELRKRNADTPVTATLSRNGRITAIEIEGE